MKQIKILLLIIGLITFNNSIYCQNLDSIKIDYSNWLQYKGLDKVFKVQDIESKKDTLTLYLAFRSTNRDSIFAIWKSSNNDFCRNNKFTLNEILFKTLINISHLKPELVNIQIYDTYNLSVEPCFYYGIYWKSANKQVVADSSFCKAKIREFTISVDLKQPKKYFKITTSKQIDIKATKQEIYTKISNAVENYFKTHCLNFENDFEKYPINPNKPLIFKISALKQEVLYHKENYWACDVISWFYKTDCRIKEFLIFTFNCDIADNEISISCSIEGKFGSFTNDNPETYNNMEPDFSYFLQKYTDNFMNKRIYPLFQ